MPQYADTRQYTAEEIQLWERMKQNQGHTFFTSKGLSFTCEIRGNELFVSRKHKSITRASVNMAYRKARQLMDAEGCVSGPKRLGVFGASYLYPVFLDLGIIDNHAPQSNTDKHLQNKQRGENQYGKKERIL